MDSDARLRELFDIQRSASRRSAPTFTERRNALKRLEQSLLQRKQDLVDAISSDYSGRAPEETLAFELHPTLTEIRHAIQNLREWMEPRTVPVPLTLRTGEARVLYQPLGVAGILAPWNYPLLLTLSPLVSAIAAGNRVLVKPSELAPATTEFLTTLIAGTFSPEHVSAIAGGPDLAEAFSRLPFDHLLFTGSTRVGRLVMRAAAENLTPVTLELGGKSPAIVHGDYPVDTAVSRILAGKLYNAGQTCVAPDYVLVPGNKRDHFIEQCKASIARMYPKLVDTREYTRIINVEHYRRLASLLENARTLGAEIHQVNPAAESCSETNRVMPPTLLANLRDDMEIMQEEIFGPLLPVVPYESLEEAIEYVNARPRPLALYYFDNNRRRIDRILEGTVSGGVSVNDTLVHLGVPDLPFGGVGASGMGHYHGFDGFVTFSKKKGVFLQGRWSALSLFRPPYSNAAQRILRMLTR